MAQGVHRYTTNFRIFTAEVVLCDERLHFITQRIVDRSLACYRGATRSFSATARL